MGSKNDKIGSSLRVHSLVGAVLRKNFSTELRPFQLVDLLSFESQEHRKSSENLREKDLMDEECKEKV